MFADDELTLDDPGGLDEALRSLGLGHLAPTLWKAETLGSLFLQVEDRLSLLARLRKLGVSSVTDRQKLVNSLTQLKRQDPLPHVVPSERLAIFYAPSIIIAPTSSIEDVAHPNGSSGVLILEEGGGAHVNEPPPIRLDGAGHRWITSSCQLDGPIMAEVGRLAPLLGRGVYVTFCDEDPFVRSPHTAYTTDAADGVPLDAAKLDAHVKAFGERVIFLVAALLRNEPSDPRVAMLPAYDSWASGRVTMPASPHGLGERPYMQRRDRAVWRGVRSGSQCELHGTGTSLRARVVSYCRGRAWADVQFGGDWGSENQWLTPEQQCECKVLLLIDGNAWASAWEWALSSGSVVCWIGVWALHVMDDLLPYEHYVPVRTDLSDLEQHVEWILAHPAEAERIAQNALALFRKVATPEHTRRSLVKALSVAARNTGPPP